MNTEPQRHPAERATTSRRENCNFRARYDRRRFLAGCASLAALSAAGIAMQEVLGPAFGGTLLSAFENARGDQFVGGMSVATGDVFGTQIPMRAHGCAIDPRDAQRVLFFARRPGVSAFELRRDTLHVRKVFDTGVGRHLAGHGLFSMDGQWLFTAEHDYENARGVICVRDARHFRIASELDSRGIDPHEITWLPTGHLLVANGGILTHPRTFRRKLNIATMDSSLCVIDTTKGACLEQWRLPDRLLSIRHLSVSGSGLTVAGLQYEGSNTGAAPGIAAIYDPKQGFQLLQAPAAARALFGGYVASVAISEAHGLIAATCPHGNGIACWNLQGGYLRFVRAGETYGLSRLADGRLLASQRDGGIYGISERHLKPRFIDIHTAMPIRWDDHWVAVT